MDKFIDLRSDTVTKPTAAMRRAMFEAEVGDDVYGEDPTVNRLEERAAEIVGKEAALFVPTGTMGNQTAIRTHTRPGHEIICDDRSHIVLYERGGPASLANCLTRTIATEDGVLSWDAIGARARRIRRRSWAWAWRCRWRRRNARRRWRRAWRCASG